MKDKALKDVEEEATETAPVTKNLSDDASKEAGVENPEDVEKEASETSEMTSVSNLSNSSGSPLLTKKDLEDMWNSFAEENGYQTINLTNKHKI